jgi:hypothetical protein
MLVVIIITTPGSRLGFKTKFYDVLIKIVKQGSFLCSCINEQHFFLPAKSCPQKSKENLSKNVRALEV